MIVKFGAVVVPMMISLPSCSKPSISTSPPSPKINSSSTYSRLFTYNGHGQRPSFTNGVNKKIQYVDVGRQTISAHGEDGYGGGGTDRTYIGARIGFADGSIQLFPKITTGTSMNGTFSWVQIEK